MNGTSEEQEFFRQSRFPRLWNTDNGEGPPSVYFLRVITHILLIIFM